MDGSLKRLLGLALALLALLAMSAAPAAAQARRGDVGFFSIGFGQQPKTPAFTATVSEPLYAETATFEHRYGGKGGGALDVGGGLRIWRQLWVGAAYTASHHRHGVDATARLPHPFRFSDPRTVEGSRADLRRDESGLHVQLMWRTRLGERLEVAVFGGPSWIKAAQDVVDAVEYSESYPYDTASFTAIRVVMDRTTGTTGGVGADVLWRLLPHVGVGAQVRHARATVTFDAPSGGQVRSRVGGTNATAGVRLFF